MVELCGFKDTTFWQCFLHDYIFFTSMTYISDNIIIFMQVCMHMPKTSFIIEDLSWFIWMSIISFEHTKTDIQLYMVINLASEPLALMYDALLHIISMLGSIFPTTGLFDHSWLILVVFSCQASLLWTAPPTLDCMDCRFPAFLISRITLAALFWFWSLNQSTL